MSDSMFRLDGRVALVTGASRGLGAAMATALAAAGADVVLHERSEPAVATQKGIQAICASRTATLTADLSDRAATDRLVTEAVEALGPIDILVNNAGIIRRTPAVDFSDEDWDAVLEVNVTAAFRLARAVGRGMIERGRGKIISVASLLAFQGGINVPAYSVSKGGVAQFTKALANEWASKGVNVNAIAPGYFDTDNTAALVADPVRSRQILDRIPAGRWGKPVDLGGTVVFLASPASDYVNGHVLLVDGGWMAR
jgi:2-dehydro-3-deoxy-D-gluconate 5-dehydrogenase